MANRPSNSGVIVTLLPDDTYVRTRPMTSDHHLTVGFLGRYDDEELTEKALKSFWKNYAEQVNFKVPAEVTAETVFWTGDKDGWAHVDLVDGPMLPEVRCLLHEFLTLHDLPLKMDHGFLPHITRRYIKSPDNQTMIHTRNRPKFTFNKVALWAGDWRLVQELK